MDVLDIKKYMAWDKEKMKNDLGGMPKGIDEEGTGTGGAYFFTDIKGKVLYVGESDNLYKRICNQHIAGKKEITRYVVVKFMCSNTDYHRGRTDGLGEAVGLGYRKMLEKVLFLKLKPVYWNGGLTRANLDYFKKFSNIRRDKWSSEDKDRLTVAYKKNHKFRL